MSLSDIGGFLVSTVHWWGLPAICLPIIFIFLCLAIRLRSEGFGFICGLLCLFSLIGNVANYNRLYNRYCAEKFYGDSINRAYKIHSIQGWDNNTISFRATDQNGEDYCIYDYQKSKYCKLPLENQYWTARIDFYGDFILVNRVNKEDKMKQNE